MSTLAWARHLPSGQILHISAARRGLACECACPGCGATLEAVNPENPNPIRRMHFRHHTSAEQVSCLQQAARAAARAVLKPGVVMTLPDYEVVATGRSADGAAVRVTRREPGAGETIARLDWMDEASGVIVLADGRQLTVRLVASLPYSTAPHSEAVESPGYAELHLLVSDPALAALPPDELLRRVSLDTACSRWVSHWQTSRLGSAVRAELTERLATPTTVTLAELALRPPAKPWLSPVPTAAIHWTNLVWAASRQVTPERTAAARQCAATIGQSSQSGGPTVEDLMGAFDAAIVARASSVRAEDWLSALAAQRGEPFANALAAVLAAGRITVMHRRR